MTGRVRSDELVFLGGMYSRSSSLLLIITLKKGIDCLEQSSQSTDFLPGGYFVLLKEFFQCADFNKHHSSEAIFFHYINDLF